MNWDINLLFLFLNGIITLLFAGYIFLSIYRGRLKNHWFYFAWFLGFLCYGIEILIRATINPINFLLIDMIMLASFTLFNIGLYTLNPKKSITLFIVLVLSLKFLFNILSIINLIPFSLSMSMSFFLLFVPTILLVFQCRVLFGRSIDKLLFGWVLLLITNIVLFDRGGVTDVFAIFSKLVLLMGVMNQDFTLLIKRVREEINRIPSSFTGNESEGGIILITSLPTASSKKVEWVKNKVRKNIDMDVDTYIFSFQDTIPYASLREIKWMKPNRVHIFLFSATANKARKDFVVLPIKIVEIGVAIYQITQNKGSEIILLDISLLIHTFGTHSVYNMLLNKLGAFRENTISVFAFFHPETHSDKSVPALFESIADEVIRL